jgi:hypothetical protein
MDFRLLGTWKSGFNDDEQLGWFRLHFFESGDLTCAICVVNQPDEVIRLTYSADGDTITTQQASPPREDQIKCEIERDGRLTLRNGWIVCPYRRVS